MTDHPTKIIKATTSEIVFLNDPHQFQLHEQDYIVIHDPNRKNNPFLLAQVNKLTQEKDNELKGIALILGEFEDGKFQLFPCRVPISLESSIQLPSERLVSKIISYQGPDGIYLGDVVTSPSTTDPFLISPKFLERHVLCVASTGAGKSYSIGVLLEEILLKSKDAAIILFDIHNEYWGLVHENTGEEISFLSYEGYKPRGFFEQILVFEKDSLGLGKLFDLQRLRRLLELSSAQENVLINLLQKPESFESISSKINDANIHSGTRDNLLLKINALKKQPLFAQDLDVESLIQPGQISIIRLDQYNDEVVRTLIVNEILTQLFERKIQGQSISNQEIIIVLEEAHRFSSRSDILTRIAREGRKFGMHEILISQRPGDLPSDIIANMNTLVALRIKSEKDITKIRLMEGITAETVSVLPHLNKGEAIIVGLQEGPSNPIKIKIRPRLTKHVNPQVDKMPKVIRKYTYLNQKGEEILAKEDSNIVPNPSEFDSVDSLKISEIKPFDYKDLANILSCHHVMILHKLTGICLYKYEISMLKIDPQLVSGFLTAITSLFTELKDELVKDRTVIREFTEEIGDRAFKIIMIEGKYSVTALLLDRSPKFKNRLKKRIRDFVYAFEDKYSDFLTEFVGALDPFDSAITLLDNFIGLSLIGPVELNLDEIEKGLHPELVKIIKDQREQLASSEGLYSEEIVNKSLLDTDYSYLEVISALIDFYQNKFLILKDTSRNLPSFIITEDDKDFDAPTDEEIKDSIISREIDERSIEIEWIDKIISEIKENKLPKQLKQDILVRNILFESDVKVRGNKTEILIFKEMELLDLLIKFSKMGYSLVKRTNNPLKGVKVILSLDNSEMIISIADYDDNNYLCVMGNLD